MCRDVSMSSVYRNTGAVQFDLDISTTCKGRLKPKTLEVKQSWPLEEVGFRFPLQGSA